MNRKALIVDDEKDLALILGEHLKLWGFEPSLLYEGKDVVEWLHLMGYYDLPVHEHPLREGVRDKTNHYVTGRDGGRDIDLRRFAAEGMRLYGTLGDGKDTRLTFEP